MMGEGSLITLPLYSLLSFLVLRREDHRMRQGNLFSALAKKTRQPYGCTPFTFQDMVTALMGEVLAEVIFSLTT